MSKKISWTIGIAAVAVLIAVLAVSKTELFKGFLPGIGIGQPIQLQPALLNYNRLAFSPASGEVIHISYQIARYLGKHEIIIYNSNNQVVRKLSSFSYMTTPGAGYVDLWNGRDDRGNLVMPGVYTYSIEGYELVPARQGESNIGRKLQQIQGVIEVLGRQPVAAPTGPLPVAAPTELSPLINNPSQGNQSRPQQSAPAAPEQSKSRL